MKTDIKIDGASSVNEILELLPKRIQKRVLRSSISASTSPVNKAAKGNAPVETKGLKKALGVKMVTYKNGSVVGIIGVRRGDQFQTVDARGRRRVPAFYQHIVHGGAKPHTITAPYKRALVFPNRQGGTVITTTVHHPGIKANPFLEKAWNASRARSMATLIGTARTRATAELQKLASKRK